MTSDDYRCCKRKHWLTPAECNDPDVGVFICHHPDGEIEDLDKLEAGCEHFDLRVREEPR